MTRRRRPLVLAGALFAVVLALFLLAPLALVVSSAFSPSQSLGVSSEQWMAGAGAARAFHYVLSVYGHHLTTSLHVALLAGMVAVALGAPAGYSLAVAGDRRLTRACETVLTLPLAVPGLATALALMTAYPGRGGELGLLVVGHVLYTLPYAVRTIAEAVRAQQLGRVLEAARTLGAARTERARLVLWPALRRSLGAASLIALAISWGEFNVTFLLATPSSGTFPTALYLTFTTNSLPVAAAATTLMLGGLLPLVLLALKIGAAPEQGA
jgi:putative spermidine/putrescine transport system permease protein